MIKTARAQPQQSSIQKVKLGPGEQIGTAKISKKQRELSHNRKAASRGSIQTDPKAARADGGRREDP